MQAPKGGMTVAGVFYKGGQFIPQDNMPKNGALNGESGKKKASMGARVIIGIREYAELPEGKRSIYQWLVSTDGALIAKHSWGSKQLTYVGTEIALKKVGLTEKKAIELIEQWNNGERFV